MNDAPNPAPAPTPGGEPRPRDDQAQADALVARLVADLPPEQAARALAVLLARAATRAHQLARTEAAARKGADDWPAWAALANATRNVVIQASTCRDLAARLTGRR